MKRRKETPNPGCTAGLDCYDQNQYWNPDTVSLIEIPKGAGPITAIDPQTGEVGTLPMNPFDPFIWNAKSAFADPLEENHGVVYAIDGNEVFRFDYCSQEPPSLFQTISVPGINSYCGIARHRDGLVYAVDDVGDNLVVIDPQDGWSTTVIPMNVNIFECGLAFDCADDRLLLIDNSKDTIYEVNTETGTLTPVLSGFGVPGEGLAFDIEHKAVAVCNFGTGDVGRVALEGGAYESITTLVQPNDLTMGPSCD